MSIYLQSTPSLRKKRMTKAQRKLLEEENERRRKRGEEPLLTLRTPKLDKDKVRSEDNMPNYNHNPRGISVAHLPSKIIDEVNQNSTARDSIMERVKRGEIIGPEADEIVRKSKCLAPPYNKAAVQYIGSLDEARDAGKKK